MKKILICTNHFREIKGSELVTLELAEYFLETGWQVTVYTNLYLSPIADEVAKLPHQENLHVTADPYEDVGTDFDLIWIQHNLLPPNIITALANGGVRAHIIWHHMSSFVHIEMPMFSQIENQIADIVTMISNEAKLKILEYGVNKRKARIFDNPSPLRFHALPDKPHSEKLENVLLVSNHPPEEVTKATDLLEKRNIKVTHLGDYHMASRITPEIIASHDAILTIGKTVQYTLPLGVPCYVYDHFGGVGWLNSNNFDSERHYNFSGRASKSKKSAETICQELVDGYSEASKYVRNNSTYFSNLWSLPRQVDSLLNDLPKNPKLKKLDQAEALQLESFCELHRGLYRTLEYYKDNFIPKEP